MRPNDLDRIRTLPVFAGIEGAQLLELTRGALLHRFPKETRLFDQGETPDFLHILIEGAVELYAAADGRETAIEILSPVDCFILAAALTDTPYLMAAKVLEPAQILLLPARSLREQIARQPQLALTMIASLAQDFRMMVRQIKDLKLRTASQRLAAFLLRLAEENGTEGTVALPFSKRILAGRLGMTPENLSRAFAGLREHDVRICGNTVIIADVAKLQAFCRPDALIDHVERNLKVSID